VSFYAAVFFLVNAIYVWRIREPVDRRAAHDGTPKVRRIMRIRSIVTLCLFGDAAIVALRHTLSSDWESASVAWWCLRGRKLRSRDAAARCASR
jgi:hypothetical protein